MKETKIRSILPILILFLLFLSTISIEGVEGDPIETNIIERHETEEWKNEEIIIDESLVIRGSLLIEDSEIYIKSSIGGEIIIEDGGTMRVIDSFIQPYLKRYYNSISLDLDEGHNLLSFPFHREDDSIRKVMSPLEGHHDSVWYFDQEEGWLSFRPERENNNIENVTQYMGVLVNITDQITLEMECFSPELFKIELQEGENWVSYPGSEKKTVGTVFYDIMDYVESVSTRIADLIIDETLNASIDEGKSLKYDIYGYLPPSAEITGVYRNDPIEVDIRHDSVYLFPEDYYWGTVNMTLIVTISEEFETEVPFTLEMEPVNNPPLLRNKTVSASYEPTMVRWEVIYEDKDGYPPTSIELVVDGDHYQMREYNESHQDAFDGKRYYYEMYLEPGEYRYHIQATENNPHGANHTINTQYYELEISPPKPGWFGLSNREMASIGTIFMFIVLVILLLKNRKDSSDDENESFRDEEVDREGMFRELPILTKKEDTDKKTSKGSTKKLPVLKKKEETKEKGAVKESRKNRLVKEIEEEEPEDAEQDVEEETEIEDKEEEQSKKQSIVKTKRTDPP